MPICEYPLLTCPMLLSMAALSSRVTWKFSMASVPGGRRQKRLGQLRVTPGLVPCCFQHSLLVIEVLASAQIPGGKERNPSFDKCQGHVAEVHAGWSSLEDPTCHTLCLEDIVKLKMHFQSVFIVRRSKYKWGTFKQWCETWRKHQNWP